MSDMTASSPDASVQGNLISYVKTRKGFILAAEVALGLVVVICYAASWFGSWIAVVISATISSVVFFVVFMMELDKQFRFVHWVWTDFFRAVVDSAFYLISSLIMLSSRYGDAAGYAGAVFGLIAGVLYAYDTHTIVQELRISRQQQQQQQLMSSTQQNSDVV